MCAVLIVVFLIEGVPYRDDPDEGRTYLGHGFDHPTFASMQHSGDGKERHQTILWWGWAFGMLIVGVFVTCLAIGATRQERVGPFLMPLLAGAVVYLAIFTLMVVSYSAYMNGESEGLFLSQVKPTAWMIYGVWLFPLVFALLYTVTFDKWYFTEDDMERFRQLVAQRKAQAGDDS